MRCVRDAFDAPLDYVMTEKETIAVRLIFLGDVVGRSGRDAVARELPLAARALPSRSRGGEWRECRPWLRHQPRTFSSALLAAGADVVTLGNHAFDQREALIFIERYPNLLRPLNWPAGCPGRGTALVDTASGRRVLVMNAMGRVMIEPVLDDPFPAVARELEAMPAGPGLRCGADRFSCRGHLREDGHGAFLRWPRQPGRRHPYPCAHGRSPDPAGRHGLSCPMPACAATTTR